jgi:hypothetical protein
MEGSDRRKQASGGSQQRLKGREMGADEWGASGWKEGKFFWA